MKASWNLSFIATPGFRMSIKLEMTYAGGRLQSTFVAHRVIFHLLLSKAFWMLQFVEWSRWRMSGTSRNVWNWDLAVPGGRIANVFQKWITEKKKVLSLSDSICRSAKVLLTRKLPSGRLALTMSCFPEIACVDRNLPYLCKSAVNYDILIICQNKTYRIIAVIEQMKVEPFPTCAMFPRDISLQSLVVP